MTRLDSPSAAPAAADLHLVAGDHARPWRRQVLLVLAGHPLQGKLVAAMRTDRGQPDSDHPVHPLGDRPAGAPPVGRTGLASRPLGMGRRRVFGERRRLALGRPPQRLDLAGQLPHTGLEVLVGVLQPVDLLAEGGVLAFQPSQLLVQPTHTANPWIAPPVPQPARAARHRAQTLRHDRPIDHPLTQYDGSIVVVRYQPLTWDGHVLGLGAPTVERVTGAAGGLALAGALSPGDWVSLHWNWVCERLNSRKLAALRYYTVRQLAIVNRNAHSAPAAVLT